MMNKKNPWFRMYHEFATDPKVQMLSEVDQRRYVMLLCLRCCNGDETLQDEEVAFQLRISNDEWDASKGVLMGRGLIDTDNRPVAWNKRQYVSDSSTARVRKHREKEKRQCNVTVTPPDTDTDTDTDTEKEKIRKKNNRKKFIPPSIQEVAEYCKQRQNSVDAHKFIDHYQANGWMRGKAKIKDWKACVRTWESNSTTSNGSSSSASMMRGAI